MIAVVKDIMTRKVITVQLSQTALDASRLMSENSIGGLVVVDKNRKPVGILIESDLVRKVLAKNIEPSGVEISSLLERKLVSTSPEMPLKDAITMMVESNVRRLPVLDRGELVGILTVTDIAKYAANYPRKADMAGIVNYWFTREEHRKERYKSGVNGGLYRID